MIITRRFNLLKHWLYGRRNDVKFRELIRNFLAPISKYKAKPLIKKIDKEGKDYYKIYFHKIDLPLYYPKLYSLNALYQVVSELLLDNDWHYYEIPQTAVCSDDIVLDCGAAEGLFSLLALQRCQKVYAVEPLAVFISALHKTFDNLSKVEILPYALGRENKDCYIKDNGIVSEISLEPTENLVSMRLVDDLFFNQGRKITYIKADLEGFDLEMLLGAEKTIKANRPKIAITTYHKKEHATEIEKFLKSLHPNYRIIKKGIEERFGAPVMLHAW